MKKSRSHPRLQEFSSLLNYALDDFQIEACIALTQNQSVLVAAPTGAGKTVVGEFAIHLSLHNEQRVFYTTPIKALSNQKFNELAKRYGESSVGLLTGDNNINSDASIVVMTTEVLRNMIYTGSMSLMNLGFVVMDEVHYLADRFRGPVWEEVILHLPKDVRIVSLSATVSNAEEFGAWLGEVRGSTKIVVSETRPVPLNQHVLFGNDLLDLFADGANSQVVNRDLVAKHHAKTRTATFPSKRNGKFRGNFKNDLKLPRLTKPEVVQILEKKNLLPAIFFIFSRAGCENAVKSFENSNLLLTSKEERESIRSFVEERTLDFDEADLAALNYETWLSTLCRGVAAHHAGMLPVFKEIVEELFLRRLVKVVFATETLALGINMPARTVVLERLDKFNGEGRVQITAGEYTQLTGRAGRRGIDNEGHAVILWSGNLEPSMVAGLASKRTYPLMSSFRPTFNMAVNLIHAFSRQRSREVLESSFAQFQADRSVVHLARTIREKEVSLSGYKLAMECHLGDFETFARLRREISETEKLLSSTRNRTDRGKEIKQSSGRFKLEKDLNELKSSIKRHPCNRCPDRESHARWGERYWKLNREIEATVQAIASRTNQVSKTFDRICNVLVERSYATVDTSGELAVTPLGRSLGKIYGERDLLLAELIRHKTWNQCDPATIAALVSSLVYESRRDEATEFPRVPKGMFSQVFEDTEILVDDLNETLKSHKLKLQEDLDPSISYVIHRWCNGSTLSSVLYDGDLLVGDFIRLAKQIIDVLEQISNVSDEVLANKTFQSIDLVKRGIVAFSYYA